MRGLGVSCSIDKGRPIVSAVLLESDDPKGGTVEVVDQFAHVADPREDFPLQLKSLAAAMESRFKVMNVDAVVVRAMDWHPNRSKGDSAQRRYASDGVVLAVARDHVTTTSWLTGVAAAASCGLSKKQLEADASKLLPKQPKEAVAAAMAALHLALAS